VLDCNAEERTCAACDIIVAVNRAGRCCGVEKMNSGKLGFGDLENAVKVTHGDAYELESKQVHISENFCNLISFYLLFL